MGLDLEIPRREDCSMTRFRFSWQGLIVLTVVLAHLAAARSQDTRLKAAPTSLASKPVGQAECTCIVYALKDLSDDPRLGQWLVQTIPQVIQPGTWNGEDAGSPRGSDKGQKLYYYPEGKILVVYHQAAVQAEVKAFLDNIKKALPTAQDSAGAQHVSTSKADSVAVPASWVTARTIKPLEPVPVPKASSYPVPAPLSQPKHLFHVILRAEGLGDLGTTEVVKEFTGATGAAEGDKEPAKPAAAAVPPLNPSISFILRYEGEGVIDNNVADVLKELYGPKNAGPGGVPCTAFTPSCLGALIGASTGCSGAAPVPQGTSASPATDPPRPPGQGVPATPSPQGPPRPPSGKPTH
jgi:hypothetical protein